MPLFIIAHLLAYSVIIIPIYILTLNTEEDLALALDVEAPILKPFINYHGVFGIPYTVLFTVLLRIVCGAVLVSGTIGLILLYIYYQMLKEYKKTFSTTTYKNQLMLFKALAIQLIDAFIFIIIPFAIVGFCASSRFKYSSYEALVALFFTCFHGIVDILALIYFIKSYRQFIFKLIKAIMKEIMTSLKRSRRIEVIAIERNSPYSKDLINMT